MMVNLTGMIKAANKIANKDSKSSAAIGFIKGIFPTFGLRREAYDAYIEDINNSNLSGQAKALAIMNVKKDLKKYNEENNQATIASIAIESAAAGTDFNETSQVDDDWLARYMEQAKFVSNENQQLVWGRILAGEFEKPGSTPMQVARILSEITVEHANVFNCICNLSIAINWGLSGPYVYNPIIDPLESYCQQMKLNYKNLSELETYGLIKFDVSPDGHRYNYSANKYPEIYLKYGNKICVIDNCQSYFHCGYVVFTDAGSSIAQAVINDDIEEYFEWVKLYLIKKGQFVIK